MKKRVKAGTSRAAAADKRRLFVEAYCTNGGNGKQAAITAGYSPRTAEAAGCRLLRNVQVAQAVEARRAEVLAAAQDKTVATAREVLQSATRDIRFDPAKLYNDDGSLKSLKDLDEDTRLALRGMKVVEMAGGMGVDGDGGGVKHIPMFTKEVKYPEKTAAREQLMKHFGLYELDNKQKPSPTVNVGVLTIPEAALNFDKVRARALQQAV